MLCTEEFTSQPPVQSVRVEDILEVIDADIIIMKIDIEGYECKVCRYNHITSHKSATVRLSSQRSC